MIILRRAIYGRQTTLHRLDQQSKISRLSLPRPHTQRTFHGQRALALLSICDQMWAPFAPERGIQDPNPGTLVHLGTLLARSCLSLIKLSQDANCVVPVGRKGGSSYREVHTAWGLLSKA